MTVETASYISQLNTSYPAVGDAVGEGDDHLRLIKAVLQTQFPNLTAAAVNSNVTELNLLDGVTALVTLAADQSWSGSQRGSPQTITEGTLIDLDSGNNFHYTPAAADELSFQNETTGQSGFIKLINPSAYTISLGSEVKKGASWDVSTAGTYLVTYYCDGTNVYVSASEALS
mgnify:CR=1 FL=1|tara:strand:- start:217 stop:735 length:519 start_codon:yes stop_codon:yes gene_type:complete